MAPETYKLKTDLWLLPFQSIPNNLTDTTHTHTIHNGGAGTRLLQFKLLLGEFWRLGEKGKSSKQRKKKSYRNKQ